MRLSVDTQPQIATNNLITKVSFENAVTDSKNGISGSAVTYARERHIKVLQVRSFHSTVASSLVNIKSVTVAWINTNSSYGMFMLPKQLIFKHFTC
jgi:hypothetical protein